MGAADAISLTSPLELILTGRPDVAWEGLRSSADWTADLTCAAAASGAPVWRPAVQAWAGKCEAAGQLHLAACHLLSIGDPHAAVETYRRHGLLREALTLASCRLVPEDGLVHRLRRQYGAQCEAGSAPTPSPAVPQPAAAPAPPPPPPPPAAPAFTAVHSAAADSLITSTTSAAAGAAAAAAAAGEPVRHFEAAAVQYLLAGRPADAARALAGRGTAAGLLAAAELCEQVGSDSCDVDGSSSGSSSDDEEEGAETSGTASACSGNHLAQLGATYLLQASLLPGHLSAADLASLESLACGAGSASAAAALLAARLQSVSSLWAQRQCAENRAAVSGAHGASVLERPGAAAAPHTSLSAAPAAGADGGKAGVAESPLSLALLLAEAAGGADTGSSHTAPLSEASVSRSALLELAAAAEQCWHQVRCSSAVVEGLSPSRAAGTHSPLQLTASASAAAAAAAAATAGTAALSSTPAPGRPPRQPQRQLSPTPGQGAATAAMAPLPTSAVAELTRCGHSGHLAMCLLHAHAGDSEQAAAHARLAVSGLRHSIDAAAAATAGAAAQVAAAAQLQVAAPPGGAAASHASKGQGWPQLAPSAPLLPLRLGATPGAQQQQQQQQQRQPGLRLLPRVHTGGTAGPSIARSDPGAGVGVLGGMGAAAGGVPDGGLSVRVFSFQQLVALRRSGSSSSGAAAGAHSEHMAWLLDVPDQLRH